MLVSLTFFQATCRAADPTAESALGKHRGNLHQKNRPSGRRQAARLSREKRHVGPKPYAQSQKNRFGKKYVLLVNVSSLKMEARTTINRAARQQTTRVQNFGFNYPCREKTALQLVSRPEAARKNCACTKLRAFTPMSWPRRGDFQSFLFPFRPRGNGRATVSRVRKRIR